MFLLAVSFVSALGLSPAIKEVTYSGQDTKLTYQVINNNKEDLKVSVYAIGEAAEYVNISDKEIVLGKDDEDKSFSVIIRGNASMGPGTISGKIIVEENLIKKGESETGIYAKLKIASILNIKRDYPDKYVDVKLDLKSEGKTLIINAVMTNAGKQKIENLETDFGIYADGKKIYSIDFGNQPLGIGEIENLSKKIEIRDLSNGDYNAVMNLGYDNYVLEVGKDFTVGDKEIKILDYTKYFLENSLNKFEIEAESNWNNKIFDVYSTIDVLKGNNKIETLRSPSSDFDKKEKKVLTAFWDTKDVKLGDYNADMNVYFSGKSSNMKGQVSVLNPSDYSKALKQVPWVRIIGIIVSVIILVNVALWFFVFRKKKGRNRK